MAEGNDVADGDIAEVKRLVTVLVSWDCSELFRTSEEDRFISVAVR